VINMQTTQTTQECPECAAAITTTPTMLGELVDCDDCGAELEAVSLDPVSFAVAPELEEDWGE
jgi:alpha-aminoadipate/glutamate carrier protein LysW